MPLRTCIWAYTRTQLERRRDMARADYSVVTSCSHFEILASLLCYDDCHHGPFSRSALLLRVATHICYPSEAIVHSSDRVGGLTVLAYVPSHHEPSTETTSTKWLLWDGLGIGPTKNMYLSPYDRRANRTNELPERTISEDPPP